MKKLKYVYLSLALVLALCLPIVVVGCKRDSADKKNARIFKFEEVVIDGTSGYAITDYIGQGAEVVLPATYNKKPVLSVAAQAFYENKDITKVTIGKNVKTIGVQAFAGTSNLKTLKFEDGSLLLSVAEKAFYCSNISGSLSLPSGVKIVDDSAFENCSLVTNISLGAATIIKPTSFKNCDIITNINIMGGTIDDVTMLVESLSSCESISARASEITIAVNTTIKNEVETFILNHGFKIK